jgi:hypothetical protein
MMMMMMMMMMMTTTTTTTTISFSHFSVQLNETDREKPKYSGKTLSQFHFVYHKSHVD